MKEFSNFEDEEKNLLSIKSTINNQQKIDDKSQ